MGPVIDTPDPHIPRFRDLSFSGPRSLEEFGERFATLERWTPVPVSDHSPALLGDYLAYEHGGDDGPGARLFLTLRGGRFFVPNIVPTEAQRIVRNDYNRLLLDFLDALRTEANSDDPAPIRDIELSDDSYDLRNEVDPHSFDALASFCATANRSTGSAHPSDRDLWFDFLLGFDEYRQHNETKIHPTMIAEWLESQGWPEDISSELAIEMEFALAVLERQRSGRHVG